MELLKRCSRGLTYPFRRMGVHYLLLTAAGINALSYPPASVEDASVLAISVYFWCGCLIVGGMLCSYGRWRRLFTPKIVGLGLLMVALLTFIVGLATEWPERIASICFLSSFLVLFCEKLSHVRRSRDADLAVRSGNPTGADLATYARDSLASRGFDHRGVPGHPEAPGDASPAS